MSLCNVKRNGVHTNTSTLAESLLADECASQVCPVVLVRSTNMHLDRNVLKPTLWLNSRWCVVGCSAELRGRRRIENERSGRVGDIESTLLTRCTKSVERNGRRLLNSCLRMHLRLWWRSVVWVLAEVQVHVRCLSERCQ